MHSQADISSIPWDRIKTAGIIGVPPLAVIRALNEHHIIVYDLDEPLVRVDLESVAPYLPRVYCAILRTAVANAIHLDLDIIFADTGPGKCDSALHTAAILQSALTIPVVATKNTDQIDFGTPICESSLPLTEKFLAITHGVKSAAPPESPPPSCTPTAGFWGVPPRDFSLLELFPVTTHVYGWTRCMENKTPSNMVLESHSNPNVPTVFFAQSFCAKAALAKWLASRHPRGLYLDVDVQAGSSARAKIQAFLELSREGR